MNDDTGETPDDEAEAQDPQERAQADARASVERARDDARASVDRSRQQINSAFHESPAMASLRETASRMMTESPAMKRLREQSAAMTAALGGVPSVPVTPRVSPAMEAALANIKTLDESRQRLVVELEESALADSAERAAAIQREIEALDLTRTMVAQQASLLAQQDALIDAQTRQLQLAEDAANSAKGDRRLEVWILVVSVVAVIVGVLGVIATATN